MDEAAATEVAPDEAGPVEAAEAPLDEAPAEETVAPELDWTRTTQVKIDGEEREVTLEELRKNYELRRSGHKRMEEVAQIKKAMAQKEAELREISQGLRDTNVLADALERLGHNPEAVIAALQKRAAIPPEEKRARELESRERRIAQQEAEFQRRIDEQRMSASVQREQERLTRDFNTALDAHGLKGHTAAIERMAAIMETALDAGYELTADEAAEAAIEEMRSTSARSLKGLSPKQLRDLIGEDAIKALRAEDLEAVKQTRQPVPSRPVARGTQNEPRRKLRVSDIDGSFFDD